MKEKNILTLSMWDGWVGRSTDNGVDRQPTKANYWRLAIGEPRT